VTQRADFGARLRQLRREKSATEERDVEQAEVAKAVGDTQPNVARWEQGRIPKEDDTVRRLAAFYGVSFVWLRHGEGEKRPKPPFYLDAEATDAEVNPHLQRPPKPESTKRVVGVATAPGPAPGATHGSSATKKLPDRRRRPGNR